MKPLIKFKTTTSRLLVLFAVGCFALPQRAQALLPPPTPDGGYPGGNTAEGQDALFSLISGTYNTATGLFALRALTESSFNTATGAAALFVNIAPGNTAGGAGALFSNTTGTSNTANGAFALFNNTAGGSNTAIGASALAANITATSNTAVGINALRSSSVSFNTAVGASALSNDTSGGGNAALGFGAGSNITTAEDMVCIGTPGQNVDFSCYIGEIFGATSSGGTGVFVNLDGKLGTSTSSRRFKEEIKPMESASEAILALKPVTFRYKNKIDPTGRSQFGLVAEEVERVSSDLVVRDKERKPYSVRYEQVNAMLLNEFLKEYRKVQEHEATIAELKCGAGTQQATIARQQREFQTTDAREENEIQALTAHLKEQDSKIQRVTDQLELSKPAPRIVDNSQ
jgi:hypothetical protein